MLTLAMSSDITKYKLEDRMVYMFHKQDERFDGLMVMNSYPNDVSQVQVKIIGFGALKCYKKTILWGDLLVKNHAIFNKELSPSHEKFSLVFKSKHGISIGKIEYKLRGNTHRVRFWNFDDYAIYRKSFYDKSRYSKDLYGKRLENLITSYLEREV